MAAVRLVLNRAEDRRILRGEGRYQGIYNHFEHEGHAIEGRAGDGFEMRITRGRNRLRVTVGTATFDAILANSQDHVLMAAMDAGR